MNSIERGVSVFVFLAIVIATVFFSTSLIHPEQSSFVGGSFSITGSVVDSESDSFGTIESITEIENCDEASITNIWSEGFEKSSENIVIFDEGCEDFEEFGDYSVVAYHVNDDGLLHYMSISGANYSGAIERVAYYFYINVSEEDIDDIRSTDTMSEINFQVYNIIYKRNYLNWSEGSIANESQAISRWNNIFKRDVENLDYETEGFNGNYYEFEEDSGGENIEKSVAGMISENYSYAISIAYYRDETDYTGGTVIDIPDEPRVISYLVLDKNLPDLTLEKGSDWVEGFDLKGYMNSSHSISYIYDYSWNLNGVDEKEYSDTIEYKVEGSKISFKPNKSFVGSRYFRFYAYNEYRSAYTNVVRVTVEGGNKLPVLLQNFGKITLDSGQYLELDLDDYFEDPEGEELDYSISDNDELNFILDKGDLRIETTKEYDGITYFYITASDGEGETKSNKIRVKGEVKDDLLAVDTGNDADTVFVTEGFEPDDDFYGSNASGEGEGSNNAVGIGIGISVAVILFFGGIIILVLSLSAKKKREEVIGDEIVEQKNATEAYLKQLNEQNNFEKDVQTEEQRKKVIQGRVETKADQKGEGVQTKNTTAQNFIDKA